MILRTLSSKCTGCPSDLRPPPPENKPCVLCVCPGVWRRGVGTCVVTASHVDFQAVLFVFALSFRRHLWGFWGVNWVFLCCLHSWCKINFLYCFNWILYPATGFPGSRILLLMSPLPFCALLKVYAFKEASLYCPFRGGYGERNCTVNTSVLIGLRTCQSLYSLHFDKEKVFRYWLPARDSSHLLELVGVSFGTCFGTSSECWNELMTSTEVPLCFVHLISSALSLPMSD